MIKVLITDAIVSKGFDGAPALRFSENNGVNTSVQFKVGQRVYDSRAEGSYRYINLAVKAFDTVCRRIEKMKIREGSHVHLFGRLDEEIWEDAGKKQSRFVAIVDDIDYAPSGGKSTGSSIGATGKNDVPNALGGSPAQNGSGTAPPTQAAERQWGNTQADTAMPPGFTGYSGFGGENPFFTTTG